MKIMNMKKLLILLLLITTNINAKDLYLDCNGSVGKFFTDYENKKNSNTFNYENVKLGVSIKNNKVHISGYADMYFPQKDFKVCKVEDVITFAYDTCETPKWKTINKLSLSEVSTGEYNRITKELIISYVLNTGEGTGKLIRALNDKRTASEFKCKEVKLD